MKKQNMSAVSSVIVTGILLMASLLTATGASAQSIAAIGEITTSGDVFIASSDGKWVRTGKTYPLLQGTAIKTGDGSAVLYFKGSSRIALSKNSNIVVTGSSSDYTVKVTTGSIAFNMHASTLLTIETPSGTVFVNHAPGTVHKVSQESSPFSAGIIAVSDQGTEVRSISGKAAVQVSTSVTKMISAGESMIIGSDGSYRVYQTQAVAGTASPASDRAGEVRALKGVSSILRADKIIDAGLNDSIMRADSVETAKESRIKLMFIDDSLLTLGELSRVSVEEYLEGDEKTRGKSVLSIISGRMRVLSGKNKLEIHAPTAVAAARGTDIITWTTVVDDVEATCFVVVDDENPATASILEVKNADAAVVGSVEVMEGQGTCVLRGIAPWPPVSTSELMAMLGMNFPQLLASLSFELPLEGIVAGAAAGDKILAAGILAAEFGTATIISVQDGGPWDDECDDTASPSSPSCE